MDMVMESQWVTPVAPRGREVLRWDNLSVTVTTPLDGAEWQVAELTELQLFAVPNGWAEAEDIAAGSVLAYRPYDDRSSIFTVTRDDAPDRAIGVSRMIWGSKELGVDGFMTTKVHDLDGEWRALLDIFGAARIAEWGTLGCVTNDPMPMFALWSALYRMARARGVDYWIQSLTTPVFRRFRRIFKMPIVQIGKEEIVVGALSHPTLVLLEEVATGNMLGRDPDLKRRMFNPWVDRPRAFDGSFVNLSEADAEAEAFLDLRATEVAEPSRH